MARTRDKQAGNDPDRTSPNKPAPVMTTSQGAGAPPPAQGGSNEQAPARRGLIPVLAFTGIAVATMQTLTVPIIGELPRLLDATAADSAWVVTATLLSGTVAAPILGRLGDLYGKRRLILIAVGLMVLGSLISGLTSSLVPMIIGRAIQGFALGAIPLGIGIIWEQVRPEKRGSAVAIMSSSIGIGGALAIPGAALVAQNFDWHWLFFGTAALGVAAIIGLIVVVPESRSRVVGRFDYLGAIGLVIGLVALLLAVSKGADWGWTSLLTIGLFIGAVIVLLLWGLYELRTTDPLLDLRSASRRQVLLTNLAAVTVGLAFFAVTLVLPQILQLPTSTGYGMGLSLVQAGVCAAAMGVAMMVVAPLAARLSAARGPKTALILGLAILAFGYLAGTLLLGAVWQLVLVALLAGGGVGIAYAAMPSLILGAVDPKETGAANGLNALMRSIGTAISSAVIGVVLASTAQTTSQGEIPTLEGFRIAFFIAAAAAILGLILVSFIPNRPRSGSTGASASP